MELDTRDLSSWDEYVQTVSEICPPGTPHGHVLFRGLRSADWELKTSLERTTGQKKHFIYTYYEAVSSKFPELQAFIGNRFPEFSNARSQAFKDWQDKLFDNLTSRELLHADFLTYLRHHGFPSPLLDWSASPFIAAFFAFRNASHFSDEDRVGIFVFNEMPEGMKFTGSSYPNIHRLFPTASHKRHFLQQSFYTVCVGGYEEDFPYFTSHQDISHSRGQDKLIKITLPANLKPNVFEKLKQMNINSGSLFGSEDSYVESLGSDLELSRTKWNADM